MDERVRKELEAVPIPSADKLSDVIIWDELYDTFTNATTGATGDGIESVIRENKNYILLRYKTNNCGVVAIPVKQHNAMVIVFCYFAIEAMRWEESCRVLVTQDEIISPYRYLTPDESVIIDMMGQVVYTSPVSIRYSKNMYIETSKALRSFTGGGLYKWNGCFLNSYNFENTIGLKVFMELWRSNNNVQKGIAEINMDGIDFEKKPIPEDAKVFLRKQAGRIFRKHVSNCNFNISDSVFFDKDDETFVYLQRCSDGNYVFRIFNAYIKGPMDKDGNMPLKYIEIKRIGMKPETLNDMRMIQHQLLAYDKEGIEDGMFKYVIPYLDKCVDKTKDLLINDNTLIGNKDMFKLPALLAMSPAFEKLYNFAKQHECIMGLIEANIGLIINAEMAFDELTLGNVDLSKKELHQILRVPKRFLDLRNINNGYTWAGRIYCVKDIFENDMAYLLSMNADDVDKLIDKMYAHSMYSTNCNYCKILKNLVTAFGGKNILNYIAFIESLDSEEMEAYMSYANKLVVVKQFVSTMDWKLKGEDLEKADESITMAYNIMNDQQVYKDTLEMFRKNFDKWQQYEFNYGDFFVTYPKGPSALVEEGLKLHHCVKEFISYVAEGSTTILFIRQKDRPLKPFYTLEVQDGIVRQVHGNSNANASEYAGLTEFIEKFCNEKKIGIDFENADRALAPD